VSKLLPTVSIVTVPADGAVHVHQTDFPPTLFAWRGSPASFVACALVPVVIAMSPTSVMRLAKLLLAGAVLAVICCVSPTTSPRCDLCCRC
jgi:hypothetical protein